MKSRFNINNGVTDPKFGDGIVIGHCGIDSVDILVRFSDGKVRVVKEGELVSNPKIGKMQNFNKGKRQFKNFKGSQKGNME
jgi:hypothetical protein